MENKNKEDLINHPAHYANHKIVLEPIDVLETLPFGIANIFKYIVRAKDKGNELQDLEKSAWYLERTIKTYTYERLNYLLSPLYIFRYSENLLLRTFGNLLVRGCCPADALNELNTEIHTKIFLLELLKNEMDKEPPKENTPEGSNQNEDLKQDDNEEKEQDIKN